jgi:hypothetical protein
MKPETVTEPEEGAAMEFSLDSIMAASAALEESGEAEGEGEAPGGGSEGAVADGELLDNDPSTGTEPDAEGAVPPTSSSAAGESDVLVVGKRRFEVGKDVPAAVAEYVRRLDQQTREFQSARDRAEARVKRLESQGGEGRAKEEGESAKGGEGRAKGGGQSTNEDAFAAVLAEASAFEEGLAGSALEGKFAAVIKNLVAAVREGQAAVAAERGAPAIPAQYEAGLQYAQNKALVENHFRMMGTELSEWSYEVPDADQGKFLESVYTRIRAALEAGEIESTDTSKALVFRSFVKDEILDRLSSVRGAKQQGVAPEHRRAGALPPGPSVRGRAPRTASPSRNSGRLAGLLNLSEQESANDRALRP